MVNDYNVALMNALHSVFWYYCLLDQDRDDCPAFFNIPKKVKYSKDCVIFKLIDELKSRKTRYRIYEYEDICNLCEDFAVGKIFNVIWTILVSMFGDYGTSPRTGWIEKRKECAEFLQQIVEIEERSIS